MIEFQAPHPIFEGHLDLAMNALAYERDQTLPVEAMRERERGGVEDERGTAMVSLPELGQGGVRFVVATLIARAKPWVRAGRRLGRMGDWPSRDMAHAVAVGHLAYYRLLEERGLLRIVTNAAQLDEPGPLGVILTLEGADPVVEPEQLRWWHAQGLRTLILAHFGRSFYAHGTPSTDANNRHDVDGPLTERGHALLRVMQELGMPLDLSHLSDASFKDAVQHFGGPIYASHSSCRALVGSNEHVHPMRMLSDAQIRAIVERDGVIGLPLFNAFLKPGLTTKDPKDAVTLGHVADHIDHICQVAGSCDHVAIGSDLDGGFGREYAPAELDTYADLIKLAPALSDRGYGDGAIDAVLFENWRRFFGRTLP